jgi:hypothetical protein
MIFHLLAQASITTDPTFSWWWDTAQKVGAGATFVLGIVVFVLARAYSDKDKALASEVVYSKDRDKQTLTVMLELTALIRGIDQRDKETAGSTAVVIAAIADVKATILQHNRP